MEKISFEGIGEVVATCKAAATVKRGSAVKMTASGQVGVCANGDRFCGVAISAEDGGFAAVQLGGLATVAYSGADLAVGWVKLAADATGGVKTDTANGGETLVLSVDTAAKRAVIRL